MSSSVCSSTHSVPDTLLELDPDRKYTILTCHTDEYAERFLVDKPFPRDLALLIARYVVDGQVMDRQGWLKVFRVDIGEEADRVVQNLGFDLDFERFYAAYHGPNPVDVMEERSPIRQVCESSLIPTIVPKRVMVEARVFEYNLNLLGQLVEYKGINGHRAKFRSQSFALEKHGEGRVKETHLHIQLKGVVARGTCWRDQVQYLERLNVLTGYGCDHPRALAQITAIFVTYVLTGKRHFGDDLEGEEGRLTYGRMAEIVGDGPWYNINAGSFRAGPIGPLGDSLPAELSVNNVSAYEDPAVGVGVSRKFR